MTSQQSDHSGRLDRLSFSYLVAASVVVAGAISCSAAERPADSGAGDAGPVDSGDSGQTPVTDVQVGAPGSDLPPPICPPAPGAIDVSTAAAVADNPVWQPGVTVTTVVGGAARGTMDGPMATATLGNPVSVILEPSGSLVVCDWDTNIVRRVTADGTASTLVKQGNFYAPFGLAYSPTGAMYVATDYNTKMQKASLTGTVWRLDPAAGTATVVVENVGRPRGLAAFPDGTIILADYQNYRVLLLNPDTANVTGLAGLGRCPGLADGKGDDARFSVPYGVAPLPDGKVLVADFGNHVLRVVASDGTVSTFSGDGKEFGTVDGPRMQARFNGPKAVAIDGAGNLFVSDPEAHRIRRIGTDGAVTTVAGDGTLGFKDGTGAEARFAGQEGIAVTADGKTVYVSDGTGGDNNGPYHRIRKITIAP